MSIETMRGGSLLTAIRESIAALLERPLTTEQDELGLADIVPDRYDSLGVLECVGMIEERFAVPIDLVDDDLRVTFRSVASIAALVARKLADAAVLEPER